MKLIKPNYKIMTPIDGASVLANIEVAGRTCYKSEDKITEDSAEEFVKMIIRKGHESVLEHQSFSVRFICDRGVSHELVRHRIASFSQESTRYCNHGKDEHIQFIIPSWLNIEEGVHSYYTYENRENKNLIIWLEGMYIAEEKYNVLIKQGWSPQQARSVLPNSLKTEIVVTANLREWRLIFKQRTPTAAHPQMRELICPLLDDIKKIIPIVFDDINY